MPGWFLLGSSDVGLCSYRGYGTLVRAGLEYREDGPEELPELIHEAEDGEEPPSCADSAEEELPELIASDEEETRAMWIGDGDDDELPEIICHEG